TEIDLFQEADGSVTGRVGGAAGTVIFAISIDNDGKLTVAQYDSLEHPTFPNSYDEAVNLDGKINAVVTVTHAAKDVASKPVGIGQAISVEDDGPSAAIGLTGTNAVLDESLGADPADPNAASDDITVANPDPFGGTYGTPIGAVSKVDVVDTTTAAGADDVGATTAGTLAIVGGGGIHSGRSTTAGTQIFLFKDGAAVVGPLALKDGATVVGGMGIEAGATDTANPAGAVAFAISINNAGEVTVAQYLSLEHPTFPNSYDEAVNLDGKINAVVTVTDGDKDVASKT